MQQDPSDRLGSRDERAPAATERAASATARRFARSRAGAWYFINVAMRVDRVLLPLSGGRASVSLGQQVGLLETVGAKSGERRRTPLLYLRDGNHVVLIASKGGNTKHPAGTGTSRPTRRSASSPRAA